MGTSEGEPRFETGSTEDWWNSSLPFAPGILENPPDVLHANRDAFAMQISEQLTYTDGGTPQPFDAT
jgi:hypothetical protein